MYESVKKPTRGSKYRRIMGFSGRRMKLMFSPKVALPVRPLLMSTLLLLLYVFTRRTSVFMGKVLMSSIYEASPICPCSPKPSFMLFVSPMAGLS